MSRRLQVEIIGSGGATAACKRKEGLCNCPDCCGTTSTAQDHVVCGPDCQCGCEAGRTIPVRSAANDPDLLVKCGAKVLLSPPTRATRSDGLGEWHTQPPGWTWRLRDRFARLLGFHCWDCMVTK